MRRPLVLAAVLLWLAAPPPPAPPPPRHWPLRGALTRRFPGAPASPYPAGQRPAGYGAPPAAPRPPPPRRPGPPAAPPSIPAPAWVGIGLLAAGLPLGALTRRTTRRRRAAAAARGGPLSSRM